MAADGQLVCSSDDDHDSLPKTDTCSLEPETCELEYLRLNGDKLVWSNNLDSLKNFVVNVLKLQGKWLTPGGNTKQFKSSNGNVIINWYSKKQQTLNFQGRDGPGLKDKLVELVRKNPGTLTDLQAPEPLVSIEQTMQPSLSEEANSCHLNGGTSIDDESSPNCPQQRPNSEIVTDIEGLKLDLLILQKTVEENSKLLSIINTKHQDENASCSELLDYKKRCVTLLSSVSKKDNAIKDLEEKCLTFESRVLSLEQENESLRLALTIIMQEKSNAENKEPKSSECWVHVDEKRGKNGNRERSQKTVRPDITETRNSFEPLRRINEAQVDVRNEDTRTANNDDRSFRRPSCRPIDVTTQRTNQSVSTESTTKRDQERPNRQKKVMIAGDSVLKHLQGHKMSRNSRVQISSFPGCTTEDMHDFIKPLLRKNPDEIILHVGTNSLRSCDTPRSCADEIIDLATMVSCESPAKIALSSLVGRSDDEALACKIAEVNRILEDCCTRKSWGFVDHSNISTSNHLNRSGLHLNKSGTSRLAQNFINYLRLD